MSDDFMIVLPTDPSAIPPKEQIDATSNVLLKMRPRADEFELHTSDAPEFFHCRGNFGGVYCPFCQTDVQEWWSQAMGALSGDPRRLSVETPCCGRGTSLNDLDYDPPQGFARVAFELMNPGPDLEPGEVQQVEAALGLSVRIVWMHI